MTREEIEQLNEVEPYCFETDREEQWYRVGLQEGLNMEILNNFSSIYCFITFVLGAMFMFTILCVVAMGKVEEPRNNVRFYVKAEEDNRPWLFLQRTTGTLEFIACTEQYADFGLNSLDFLDMKKGMIIEVFLNLED